MRLSLEKQTAITAFHLVGCSINTFFVQYGDIPSEEAYLSLVVLDKDNEFDENDPEAMILHEANFTLDPNRWKNAPFLEHAREAAYWTYRREIRGENDFPTFTHCQGILYQNRIIGASGPLIHFNEMCAMWLATTFHALTIHYDAIDADQATA